MLPLDLAGWKAAGSPFPSANRYANLDRIAELYRTDAAPRRVSSGITPNSSTTPASVGCSTRRTQPATPTSNSATCSLAQRSFSRARRYICYYLFYPGHDEGLKDCPLVDQAAEFGSFAGDWTAVVILLDRPSPADDYTPKLIGLSNHSVFDHCPGLRFCFPRLLALASCYT